MSNLSQIFTNSKVRVPNKSGFDLSHITSGTLTTGTLVPVLCEPLLPNDSVSLGALAELNFAPFATQPYGKIDFAFEAFFVPYRILWGGWQNFYTMPVNNPYGTPTVRPISLPSLSTDASGPQSLADYLGYRGIPESETNAVSVANALPFLAYHKIYDDWYRNALIQKPLFVRTNVTSQTSVLSNMPWFMDSELINDVLSGGDTVYFANGDRISTLHQRNWGKDYFTTATLYPQASGDPVGAGIEVPAEGDEISIAAIRQANVLQKWLERNNIAGPRYADQIKATFGIMPSDAVLDRPVFLGSVRTPVYTKGVNVTANGSGNTNNPYVNQPGATAGSALGVSRSSLIDGFTASEHGFLMVLASVVPHAEYSSGVRRYLYESTIGDIPNPMLQGLGEQAIYHGELFAGGGRSVFGYQQQYGHYKFHDDEVHGFLRDGEILQPFAIQRHFVSKPQLGSEFLQIPTDALDQVTAVSSNVSNYIAWYNIGFEFKKVSTLSQFVIPTLGELPNQHTENIPYRGRSL